MTVPEGQLWVMGDHRAESADSRAHVNDADQGTIPVDNVIGKAVVIVWPVDRWSTLGTPSRLRRRRQARAVHGAVADRDPGRAGARDRVDDDETTTPRPLSTLRCAMTDPLRPPRALVRRDAGLWACEGALRRRGFALVAGADEAGRGACAGPLVVAACILPDGKRAGCRVSTTPSCSPRRPASGSTPRSSRARSPGRW